MPGTPDRPRAPSLLARVEAIIYDFDGTLFDSMPTFAGIAAAVISRRYGVTPEFGRRRYLETAGADFATQLDEIFPADPRNPEASEEFESTKEQRLPDLHPFPDAAPALARFRSRGVEQFVCSGTREELMQATLERAGLIEYLDGWLAFHRGFDKGQQIAAVVATYGLDPAHTIFVGDSARDATFARAGGVPFRRLLREGNETADHPDPHASPSLTSLFEEWEEAQLHRR